jgi:hypothetical protein
LPNFPLKKHKICQKWGALKTYLIDIQHIIKQQITNKDQVIDNLFEQIKQKDEQIYKLGSGSKREIKRIY